jgi:hypothetical protein
MTKIPKFLPGQKFSIPSSNNAFAKIRNKDFQQMPRSLLDFEAKLNEYNNFFNNLQHPFVANQRPSSVIAELINRIKNAVREQDQSQYGKLRKLVCLEEGQNSGNQSETCSVEAQHPEVIFAKLTIKSYISVCCGSQLGNKLGNEMWTYLLMEVGQTEKCPAEASSSPSLSSGRRLVISSSFRITWI